MGSLRTRKPTGLAPWPVLLIEGQEKTGKSYIAARLTADPRIGHTWWLDLGEGAGDQYAAMDGVEYDIVMHDGSYRDLLAQVKAFVAEIPGVDADGKPNLLVIDSVSNLWGLLKAEADAAARKSKYAQRILASDPDGEVPISMDKWNRARDRWRAIIDPLIQWPGLVILTARGKETAKVGPDGKPVAGERDYSVEGHKSLGFDVDVIVRPVEPGKALLMGARSVHVAPQQIGRAIPGYQSDGLAAVLFGLLKLGEGKAGVRDYQREVVETESDVVTLGDAKRRLWDVVAPDKARAAKVWAAWGLDGDTVLAARLEELLAALSVEPLRAADKPAPDPARDLDAFPIPATVEGMAA